MKNLFTLLLLCAGFSFPLPMMGATEDVKSTVEKKESYDLQQCIKTALIYNNEIAKARERIERQRGVLIEARAGFFPRISLNSNFQQIDAERLQSFGGGTFGSQSDWSVNVEIVQSLYTGGRVTALNNRENHNLDATLFDFQRVIADVLLQVRERYYAVLLAREQVKVQELNIKLLEEELQGERNRFKAGSVPQFNVLRSEVALANSRPALIRNQNGYRIALEQLHNVLGLPHPTPNSPPLNVVGEFQYSPKAIELDSSLTSAMEQRPELQQLQKISNAEAMKIRMVEADYQPTVDAVLGYGVEKSRFGSSLKEELHGWTAGVRGTWNLFDGFAREGRLKQADSDFKISVLNLEQQRLNIDIEVRQAYSSLMEAVQLIEASRKVIAQAEESLRLAKSRLSVGAGTQLDLFQTQVALTEARTNEVVALHDYHVAYARLTRATGQSENFEVKEKEEPKSDTTSP